MTKSNHITDCEQILKEKCPHVTPDCVDKMDTYLTGACHDAVNEYKKCIESKQIVEFDSEYLRVVNNILDNGTWQLNERTGKRCLFYHGDMMKFDMSSGYFPLLTTKQMKYKSMIGELLGFLKGVNSAKDFRDLKCKFWDANANKSKHWLENPNRKGEDDLGRIYGVQARNRQTFFKQKKQTYDKPKFQKIEYNVKDFAKLDYSNNEHGMIGKIYNSVNGGQFKVVKEIIKIGQSPKYLYDIQFLKSGHIVKNVQKGQIAKKKQITVKDPYHPSLCGIAAMGVPENKEYAKLLIKPWREMINRCYSSKIRMNNKWYKDKNVFVESRWLLFENFVEDFTKIDRWELKLEFSEEYTLDKDFYSSNMYSKKTCVWASKREQNINTSQAKKFKAIAPDGSIYHECGSKNFSEKHNLNRRSLDMAISNDTTLNGWKFEEMVDDDYVYRIRIDDQLAHCIAKIKHNPTDRRMIVDHWNPNELHLMALPPCHLNYSFGIRNGHLDMCMFQRSCDVPLGIPMNIASYALLLNIVAKITGLKVGEFTHFMWNIHIYEDQLETLKEQIQRKPLQAPKLRINKDFNTLEDVEQLLMVDDFEFIDYNHQGELNFPFAE